METVNIYAAQPSFKSETIEPIALLIEHPIPEPKLGSAGLEEARQVFKKEAETICEALCSHLPQGTVDALLVELLDRKRSLFIIAMPKKEG